MDDKLMGRIEGVCQLINGIFQHNEHERVSMLIEFAEMASRAPDLASLDAAVRMIEEALQAGIHNAKMEILGYLGGGKA